MILVLIVVGYLIGSIPIAWIVAKLVTGQDLRQVGSGNVGVMNVAISVARWAGVLVFVAEAAKAVLAVTLARSLDGRDVAIALTVLATIVGTRWSIWLRGAGGRGNTVGVTSLLLISWLTLVIGTVVWLLARVLTRSSFLATRISLIVWPAILGLVTQSAWYVLIGAAFGLLFMSTHRRETDDHLVIKERWAGLRRFLTMPPRKK